MTAPGSFIVTPNGLNNGAGQLIIGPPGMVGDTAPAVSNLAVPAAQVQEVVIAPTPAKLTGLAVGNPVLAWLTGAAGAAEIMPYARVSAPGVVSLCTGNLGVAPAGFGPADVLLVAGTGLIRHQLVNSGIDTFAGNGVLTFPSPGPVANRTQAEASVGALINSSTLLMVNPQTALPAGFMIGYARPGVFSANVALANLGAAPADPGALDMLVSAFSFGNTVVDQIPGGQNGPIASTLLSGVTFTFGLIAGATVLEAVATGLVSPNGDPFVAPGDATLVVPRLAMPNPSLAPSHSRVTASGSLAWGIGNIDPAVGVTPGAIVADVLVWKAFPLV